jgi:hypothetical protein
MEVQRNIALENFGNLEELRNHSEPFENFEVPRNHSETFENFEEPQKHLGIFENSKELVDPTQVVRCHNLQGPGSQ